jgi:hypothetical protein
MLTDHRKHPDWVTFDNLQQQRAAYATATADLIGQMANREYLERVLFLYYEFEEAQMGGFADIHDLLEKTTAFYNMTKGRLDKDLQGMSVILARHFGQQTGADRNFYQESIDRNLAYLEQRGEYRARTPAGKTQARRRGRKSAGNHRLPLTWSASPFRSMPSWRPNSTA